jgi:hypothetical protein
MQETAMAFVVGERVIWRAECILKVSPPRRRQYIAAEVVQDGPLRVRIRIDLANGGTALRWVKPENVRCATPELRGEAYPHG